MDWENNLPAALRASTTGRIADGVVIRYYRQLPPELVLPDSVEDLVRPALSLRRARYTYTFWGRPRLLRCTGLVFCLLRGVGAGEPTPEPAPSMLWPLHVQEEGFWKEAVTTPTPLTPPSAAPHWRLEV